MTNKLKSVKNISFLMVIIFCIVAVFTKDATFKEATVFLMVILPAFWAINVAQKKVLK